MTYGLDGNLLYSKPSGHLVFEPAGGHLVFGILFNIAFTGDAVYGLSPEGETSGRTIQVRPKNAGFKQTWLDDGGMTWEITLQGSLYVWSIEVIYSGDGSVYKPYITATRPNEDGIVGAYTVVSRGYNTAPHTNTLDDFTVASV